MYKTYMALSALQASRRSSNSVELVSRLTRSSMVSAAAATAATEEPLDPVAASATPPNILRTKSIPIAKFFSMRMEVMERPTCGQTTNEDSWLNALL